ncbi:bifunctional aminotransferase class I/II-fold pyridoxal phosphate-dependent enzyme/GNAT family N-acetyltransferase [Pontibacter mangrovi]|uniref:GNAT family N-acetyltransferase n=1 Tax=Pontibacter mangrovi TaxID=2589816 RepID=A0A501W6S5_9BACT|nr:bifunctional aminotransferase class I/II-fold pyridoxal phosphate-dependent enzyme/GNAT family N-acetyltransferase [Pontibacter mangrovi]TPE44335.1 GNAT family N-acetyltransferase [Pontibacter mangrovi]
MAKIRHNNILDTVDSVLSVSKKNGIIHLHAQDDMLTGQHLTLKGRKVLHFGTCGYLGLEHHPALKQGAIEAIQRYGTQFPMSRTYVSNPLYAELEQMIQAMYQAPAVISKNCTLAHLTTIPSLIRQSDLVILDHQVHASVQEAVKKMLSQGVTVEMIRHNNLEMLEDRILKLRSKYERIWYMADGVYSMYGDFAPIKDLIALAEKYEQLYLYVDDAHGMSWAGQHGTGYVMSQMDNRLYRKMVLTANLGKAFGACGGVSLFPNEEWYHKVNNFGGPLTFSVQIEPATLGAAIASAKIHLSDEIYTLQEQLQQKILYFNLLLQTTNLPLVHESNSPIFFIGTGTMDMGNYLVQALLQDGIYVNLATFPAVPAKNIGIRITISLHNTFEDIEQLVERLQANFAKALQATNQTQENIRKAFKMPAPQAQPAAAVAAVAAPAGANELKLQVYTSIGALDADLWNRHLGKRGMFDWDGMQFLEKAFSGNGAPEHDWDFRYYQVQDAQGDPVLMTFFVTALYKEDIFSRVSVSKAVEQERELNPYYLTTTGIIMGSLFTEGNHMYLNRQHPAWKNAFKLLLEELYQEQEKTGAGNIMLRDFDAGDPELDAFMVEQNFVKADMPESCVVTSLGWTTEAEYLAILTKENRRNYSRYIKRYEQYFDVEVRSQLPEEELQHAIRLFGNVKERNLGINNFLFPEKVFREMNKDSRWEFVTLKLKKEFGGTGMPVAVCFCQKNAANVYSFMLTGLDYEYTHTYGAYRRALFQVVQRANELGCEKVNMGISATLEKKRVGARPHPKVAYLQAKDNYVLEMLEATIAIEKD